MVGADMKASEARAELVGATGRVNHQLNPKCAGCPNRPPLLYPCGDGKERCLNCRAKHLAAGGKAAEPPAPRESHATTTTTLRRAKMPAAKKKEPVSLEKFREVVGISTTLKDAARRLGVTDGSVAGRCKHHGIPTPAQRRRAEGNGDATPETQQQSTPPATSPAFTRSTVLQARVNGKRLEMCLVDGKAGVTIDDERLPATQDLEIYLTLGAMARELQQG